MPSGSMKMVSGCQFCLCASTVFIDKSSSYVRLKRTSMSSKTRSGSGQLRMSVKSTPRNHVLRSTESMIKYTMCSCFPYLKSRFSITRQRRCKTMRVMFRSTITVTKSRDLNGILAYSNNVAAVFVALFSWSTK